MIPVISLVTDRSRWGEAWMDRIPEQVAVAAQSGVSLIQVREPGLEGAELYELVRRCVGAVRGTLARVVVNERLDVAVAAGAHGVHLRHDGVPAPRARAVVGRPFLIGRSIHSVEEARQADGSALDYLLFGTVFETASKPGRAAAGPATLCAAVAATPLPVLAIGGITPDRAPRLVTTGAAGLAAIGVFVATPDQIRAHIRALQTAFDTTPTRSLR